MRELGITHFGISDHVHNFTHYMDISRIRNQFDYSSDIPENMLFGIEVSSVSQWELDQIAKSNEPYNFNYGIRKGGPAGGPYAIAVNKELIEKFKIDYIVGGVHWPLYVPYTAETVTRDYFGQLMFLVNHELIDIIAHPWWWYGYWNDDDGIYRSDPYMDDFSRIPMSMHEEFIAAVKQNKKKVEINISAMLLNMSYTEKFRKQYTEYLAYLQQRGIELVIGSDCHNAHYTEIDFAAAEKIILAAGIDIDSLATIKGRFRHK